MHDVRLRITAHGRQGWSPAWMGLHGGLSMLVLSRKKNESIIVGKLGEVEICVVEIRHDRVRIGINAPDAVPVHRKEVWLAIQRELAEGGSDGSE